MSLDKLKILSPPPAFDEFARKHNALVDILAGMTGKGPIKVTVSENNILITLEGYAETQAELCPSGTVTVLTKS